MIRDFKIILFCNSYLKKAGSFFATYLILGMLRLLLSTCRLRVNGLEAFTTLAEHKTCILMFWHNRLIPVPYFLHRLAPQFVYSALISKSRDGDLLTNIAQTYSQAKIIRVSHQAKFLALHGLIKRLKGEHGVILMTPDGPRGPKYQIKKGVVLAAQSSQAKIIPFSWSASRFWQLSTWDRLRIPKPFSKIEVYFGGAVDVGSDSDQGMRDLENAMHHVHKPRQLQKS